MRVMAIMVGIAITVVMTMETTGSAGVMAATAMIGKHSAGIQANRRVARNGRS